MSEASPIPESEAHAQPPPIPLDQQRFMDRLRAVNERGLRPLPDLAANANHTGLVIDEAGLHDRLTANLSEEVLAPFNQSGESPPGTLTFTPRHLGKFGKEESHRGVFFGELNVASGSGTSVTLQVAVKQYPIGGQNDAVHNAIQECTMLAYLNSIGMDTVAVAGIIADRYSALPTLYVITHQKAGLESLDELQWSGIRRADLHERLQPVIDTLSSLHEVLVFQGDPKFKNIGLGEDGGVIIFDVEHATSVRDLVANMNEANEEEVMELMARQMRIDFNHVLDSLRKKVFVNLPENERPRTPLEEFEFEHTYIMEPYTLKIMESASQHKNIIQRVYARILQERHGRAAELQKTHDSQA